MVLMFTAVFLVMAGLIIVLTMVIRRGVQGLNHKVKEDFLNHLKAYDQYIDSKSETLQELRDQLTAMEKKKQISYEAGKEKVEFIAMADSSTDYVDANFHTDYALVQSKFKDFAYESMKEKCRELFREKQDITVNEYLKIRQDFTPELQYEILTLSEEDQTEILAAYVEDSAAKKKILESYILSDKKFSFNGFLEFIDDYIHKHDFLIRVFSYTGEPCLEDAPPQVVFYKDRSIAEGYIVRYQDRVYDYSL